MTQRSTESFISDLRLNGVTWDVISWCYCDYFPILFLFFSLLYFFLFFIYFIKIFFVYCAFNNLILVGLSCIVAPFSDCSRGDACQSIRVLQTLEASSYSCLHSKTIVPEEGYFSASLSLYPSLSTFRYISYSW